MDVAGYLIYYFLTNIVNHPLNVFLLFTTATTIISFFLLYVGKAIYSKFKKKNNITLFITTALTVLIYLLITIAYDFIFGRKISFSVLFWIYGTISIFILAKLIERINNKWIEKYNLPEPLKFFTWALIGSSISWALIITSFLI